MADLPRTRTRYKRLSAQVSAGGDPVDGVAVGGAGVADGVPGAVGVGGHVEDQVEVGPVAVALGHGVLVVEVEPADVTEGIGTAVRPDPDGFALDVGRGLFGVLQHGEQEFAGGCVEVAVDPGPAGEGAGGVSRWGRWGRGRGRRGGPAMPAWVAPTSGTERGSSTGTISASWRADAASTVSLRNEQMVSTCPVDRRPSAHAPAVTGSWATSRATRTFASGTGAGHAALVRGPRGHRRRPHHVPQGSGVHHVDHGGDAGVEPVPAGQRTGQVAVVDVEVEPGDGGVEIGDGGRDHADHRTPVRLLDMQNHRKILTNTE